MFRIRNLVEAHRKDLAAFLTAEHGKVPSDALGEIARGIENLEFATGIPSLMKGGFSEQVSTGVDVYQIRQPLGVVAGITPFNFPAMVPMWMFANAIASGNTFVLKPSEKDPSASIYLAELLKEAGVPDGVFNVVQGDKVAVDRILEHPDIAAVSFVGSTPIARYIYETGTQERQARPGPRRREEPHDRPAGRGHRDGGRRRRLRRLRLVRRALHGDRDGRRRRLRGRSARRGDREAPAQDQGRAPGRTRRRRWARSSRCQHREKVASYLESAPAQGATVVADGRDHPLYGGSAGFFLGTSLIDHVTPAMDCYRDEIFGPVLTVTRVATYDEALKLVNDNPYGNGTAIFTRDGGAARQYQFDVNVGMVGINVSVPVPVSYYSFGGWKASLFGDLHMYGPEGIQFYTRAKIVTARWPDPGTSKVDLGFPRTR